jgi:hypothetical protein
MTAFGHYSGGLLLLTSTFARMQVQDFTQAELALDLRVAADPNGLFYCGKWACLWVRGSAGLDSVSILGSSECFIHAMRLFARPCF